MTELQVYIKGKGEDEFIPTDEYIDFSKRSMELLEGQGWVKKPVRQEAKIYPNGYFTAVAEVKFQIYEPVYYYNRYNDPRRLVGVHLFKDAK